MTTQASDPPLLVVVAATVELQAIRAVGVRLVPRRSLRPLGSNAG